MNVQEITAYLRDVYELEQQLFTLNRLKEEYENVYEELEEFKNEPLHEYEYYDGTRVDEDSEGYCLNKDRLGIHEYFHNLGTSFDHTRPHWKQTQKYIELCKADCARIDKFRREKKRRKLIFFTVTLLYLAIFFYLLENIPFLAIGLGIVLVVIYRKAIYDFVPDSTEVMRNFAEYYQLMFKEDMIAKENFYQERINIVLSEYKDIILESIIQTEKVLEKVYSKDIIHTKYRNLVAVGQIYEYFDTGRCNDFEGPNGAYNLFEKELRQNIIIIKLDDIISKLEELNTTMYYIANAIDRSNMLLGDISSKLGAISTTLTAIEHNTSLTAYNSQCIASNSRIMGTYY